MQSHSFHPVALVLSMLAGLTAPALFAPNCDAGEPSTGLASGVDLEKNLRTHNAGQTAGAVPPGMVLVKGGTATIGISQKEMLELGSRENYKHIKYMVPMYPSFSPIDPVEDLLVDVHEVTNIQYKMFLDANQLEPSEDLLDLCWNFWVAGTQKKGLPPGRENLAVGGVNFHEAKAVAAWLGKRLPTEIEWEYVARRGLDSDYYYPWGKGWDAWKRENCSNVYVSAKGDEGMLPGHGGAFPTDRSTDGVEDLCGGVAEWTTSPFDKYPGFKPIKYKAKGQRKSNLMAGEFNSEYRVYRGGCFIGNEFSNSLVYRAGSHPNSVAQGVGLRCVKSATPGLDQLRYAAHTQLTLMSSDIKGQFSFDADKTVAQELIWTNDEGLIQQADCLAFTNISRTQMNDARFRKESIENPQIVGILTTTQPIADPPLPAGAYAIFFRGAGETVAQKEAAKEARKNKNKNKPAPVEEKADDKKKPGRGAKAKKDEDEKKEGENEEGEAEAGTEEGEEAAEPEMTEEEKAAKKALEDLGAIEAEPLEMVALPTDKDMLLFYSPAGNMVGWIETPLEKTKTHPTTLGYRPNAGKIEGSPAGAARATVAGQTNDLAEIRFSLHWGSGSNQPELVIPLEFAPSCFEPMTAPSFAEDKK